MRDEWFIRGNVPMTKSEVRAVSLSKLELCPGSVLWDVGAGTGSVSVEAALTCPGIRVAAFERNPEAVALIRKNCEKAGTKAVTIVEGIVPLSFPAAGTDSEEIPLPTHAFIGGTAGRMEAVLDELLSRRSSLRVVINVIALESLTAVLTYLKERGIPAEILSLQVAKAEKIGGSSLMKGQNPVYIISFGGNP